MSFGKKRRHALIERTYIAVGPLEIEIHRKRDCAAAGEPGRQTEEWRGKYAAEAARLAVIEEIAEAGPQAESGFTGLAAEAAATQLSAPVASN